VGSRPPLALLGQSGGLLSLLALTTLGLSLEGAQPWRLLWPPAEHAGGVANLLAASYDGIQLAHAHSQPGVEHL
jgi:hypothetical protein